MYEYLQPQMYNPYQRAPAPIPIQIIKVNGIDGAKAYQMQSPNSSVALFDENQDVFYVKQTDGAGFPTIRSFKFEPIEVEKETKKEYVTRTEFEELKGMVNDFGKQFVRRKDKSYEPDFTVGADG